MHDLIFAYSSGIEDVETLILAESIREFAGKFSNSPIWLYTIKEQEEISEERRQKLESLDVTIKQIKVDKEIAKFPFIDHVCAAAQAEEEAKEIAKNLVYLGTNAFIIKEPKEFILQEGINLGYRPVHHKLIGSLFDENIDRFWEIIYEKCNVTEDKIFPMKTHVDGNILRPYINSGYLIVNPRRGFLGEWWKYYQKLYNYQNFKEFYEKDDLYLTFIHQAVLSGVFLSFLSKNEVKELPFNYNYPINLYQESPEKYKPASFQDLVTARYYLVKLLKPEEYEKLPFHEPLKTWLSKRIH
ncbi:MAG: hypothetical protein ACTSQF_06145 [Candidatus Heimdallarchaeaceae archaeon]